MVGNMDVGSEAHMNRKDDVEVRSILFSLPNVKRLVTYSAEGRAEKKKILATQAQQAYTVIATTITLPVLPCRSEKRLSGKDTGHMCANLSFRLDRFDTTEG